MAIDTLSISKRLQQAGYNREQADAHAEIWADVIEDHIATKSDIKQTVKDLEYRLTMRLGSMIVVAIGIVATLVKLL